MWGGPVSYRQPERVDTYQAQMVSTMATSTAIQSKSIPAPPKRTSVQSPLEAMQLYYHYFYLHLSKHDDLVDVEQMENLWGPQDLLDFSKITSHVECFSVYSTECPVSAVWLMATIIAAAQECIFPSTDTYTIIADVFEKCRQSHMVERTFTEGSRASRLRGDFDYWKRFAESRGLDQAISAYLYRNKLISNVTATSSPAETLFSTADKEEMICFLLWLIGNKEKPKNDIRPTFSVRSARVFAVALSMQWVGIRIATKLAPSGDTEPITCSCWPLVLYGNLNSSQPHAETLASANRVSSLTIDFVQ
jgi:hypothetical protein